MREPIAGLAPLHAGYYVDGILVHREKLAGAEPKAARARAVRLLPTLFPFHEEAMRLTIEEERPDGSFVVLAVRPPQYRHFAVTCAGRAYNQRYSAHCKSVGLQIDV